MDWQNNWQMEKGPWNNVSLCICCSGKLCDRQMFPNNDKHLARVCLSRARESSRTRRSASSWVEAAYSWSSRASPVSRAASEQLVSCKISLKLTRGWSKRSLCQAHLGFVCLNGESSNLVDAQPPDMHVLRSQLNMRGFCWLLPACSCQTSESRRRENRLTKSASGCPPAH